MGIDAGMESNAVMVARSIKESKTLETSSTSDGMDTGGMVSKGKVTSGSSYSPNIIKIT